MKEIRKVFVCKDCEFIYCDEKVSSCDCMGTSGFIEGVAIYPFKKSKYKKVMEALQYCHDHAHPQQIIQDITGPLLK